MSSPTPPGERVALVVEDEWLVRMEIADAFSDAGWQVLEATSGEEAVALLASGVIVTLLVTDIRLSGAITGWDVAERYRAAQPRIGVIYASANPTIATRQVAGGIFVGKPTRISELLALSERIGVAPA